jgi:hypothetical protein
VIDCWLADSLHRIYPRSQPEACSTLRLDLLRGERGSFQIACRTGEQPVMIEAHIEAPAGVRARVRRVGYVPMAHIDTGVPPDALEGVEHVPGYVPDPLFPESAIVAGPFETNSFWISLEIDADCPPGDHDLVAELTVAGEAIARFRVAVTIHPATLRDRRDVPVTNWFYANAIVDWYGTDGFDERFWRLLDPYFANLAAHGHDTIYSPIFTPPLDGEKRPTQLVGVEQDGERYHFDWSLVRRWIAAARAAGPTRFEWSHLVSQWGAANAIAIYFGHGETGERLWSAATGATSERHRTFLSQFLPAFGQFLREEGVLEASFFHLSDEPHGQEHLANYRAAREMVREVAPWMPVMDALSEVAYAREGLVDIPVALLPSVPAFRAGGYPCWAYYCNQPRGRFVNRFLDTPLSTIRMTGWLLYASGAGGFLHWGYNSWYGWHSLDLIDPFQVTDAASWPRWTYGDPFVVYPGEDGPLDSIRWEMIAESLQDYAVLQAAGITPDDPLLAELIDFETFPRESEWIIESRRDLIRRLC